MTTKSNDKDPRVSKVYQSVATETTPPELDRKILSMAAGSARSRYGLARAWIRPVAWAATIGLSLAFVLEMAQVRDIGTSPVDVDIAAPLEERIIRDDTPAAAEPAPKAEALPATGRSVSDEFEADEMTLLEEAEEQARARSGSERTSAGAAEALTFDAAMSLEVKKEIQHCDQDARSSEATWYACVEELRASGLAATAELELESLRAEFPDFEEPHENK